MSATKPENRFISGLHRKIPTVYAEKMNNPWRSGTADVWYSGQTGDLWVEYKFIEHVPNSKKILPALTPRQQKWLNDRCDEGRNVAVVLGTPDGGVIYRNKEWMIPLSTDELLARLVPAADLAKWIYHQVGDSRKCPSST